MSDPGRAGTVRRGGGEPGGAASASAKGVQEPGGSLRGSESVGGARNRSSVRAAAAPVPPVSARSWARGGCAQVCPAEHRPAGVRPAWAAPRSCEGIRP